MTTTRGTARLTGLAYLGLAVSGMLAFLFIRQQLYVPDDAAATLTNLVEREGLARVGIAADLTVVLSQALAALGFFRLFRPVSSFAAGAIAAFGLVNAVVVLVATAFSATALDVALGEASAPGGRAESVQLLYELSGAAWAVGGLFFGLWLLPMGWLAWRSGYMPRPLGWVLIAGGIGYVMSTYLLYLAPGASSWSPVLTAPASVGELWMVVYLLWKGVRPAADATVAQQAEVLR